MQAPLTDKVIRSLTRVAEYTVTREAIFANNYFIPDCSVAELWEDKGSPSPEESPSRKPWQPVGGFASGLLWETEAESFFSSTVLLA